MSAKKVEKKIYGVDACLSYLNMREDEIEAAEGVAKHNLQLFTPLAEIHRQTLCNVILPAAAPLISYPYQKFREVEADHLKNLAIFSFKINSKTAHKDFVEETARRMEIVIIKHNLSERWMNYQPLSTTTNVFSNVHEAPQWHEEESSDSWNEKNGLDILNMRNFTMKTTECQEGESSGSCKEENDQDSLNIRTSQNNIPLCQTFKSFGLSEIENRKDYVNMRKFPNLGKTCFINAALQFMFSSDKILQGFVNLSSLPLEENELHLIRSLVQLATKITEEQRNMSYICYRDNLVNVRYLCGKQINKMFDNGKEQDAQELLIGIMSIMDNDCIKSSSPFRICNYTKYEKRECKCNYSYDNEQTHKNIWTYVEQWMDKFPVQHFVDNQTETSLLVRKCEVCEREEELTTTTIMSNLPECLMIMLCRFADRYNKIHSIIGLDEFVTLFDGMANHKVQYQLKSVLCHRGELISNGHYFTYAMKKDGQCVLLNDNKVQIVSKKEMIDVGSNLCTAVMYMRSDAT